MREITANVPALTGLNEEAERDKSRLEQTSRDSWYAGQSGKPPQPWYNLRDWWQCRVPIGNQRSGRKDDLQWMRRPSSRSWSSLRRSTGASTIWSITGPKIARHSWTLWVQLMDDLTGWNNRLER